MGDVGYVFLIYLYLWFIKGERCNLRCNKLTSSLNQACLSYFFCYSWVSDLRSTTFVRHNLHHNSRTEKNVYNERLYISLAWTYWTCFRDVYESHAFNHVCLRPALKLKVKDVPFKAAGSWSVDLCFLERSAWGREDTRNGTLPWFTYFLLFFTGGSCYLFIFHVFQRWRKRISNGAIFLFLFLTIVPLV